MKHRLGDLALLPTLALCIGFIEASAAFAQEPVTATRRSPGEMRVLRDRILTERVTVDTQPAAAAGTAATPAAGAAAAAASDATSAGDGQAAAGVRPGIGALVAAPRVLRAGVLYHVKLPPAEERATQEVVSARVAEREPANSVVSFPGVLRQLTQDQKEIELKPYALVGQPLTYVPARGEFVGSIRLGIVDLFDGSEGRALTAPVTFDVLEADVADPNRLELKATSPPHGTIRVHAANPRNPFVVRVASRFNQEGVPVALPVNPTLFIRTDRREIQGYGLETTKVYVSALALAEPEGFTVQLEADPSAHFEKSLLTLSKGGTAETTLRSDANGVVILTATGAGIASGTAKVLFRQPWRTLASATLGGILGGVLRMYTRARPNTHFKHRVSGLLISILAGIFVFVLYVVGVNVLPVNFLVQVGDVFVLAVSALGAWIGTAALKQFKAA